MIGTIVNTIAVAIGGTIGIIVKKRIPEKIIPVYFQVIGLFTMALAISLSFKMEHSLLIVISLVIGTLLGMWWHLEERVETMGNRLKKKFHLGGEHFSEGLVSAFLLFCVGAMTILGTIQEGTQGSADLLYTKSLMDFVSAIILGSAFGAGVVVSAIPLFIFQGVLTLLAGYAGSFFTDEIIAGLTNTGGILLLGLSIDILKIKKLPVMNMLPSLIIIVIILSMVH